MQGGRAERGPIRGVHPRGASRGDQAKGVEPRRGTDLFWPSRHTHKQINEQSEMKGVNESKSSAGAVQRQTLQEVESTKHERDVAKIVVSDDWGIGVRRTRVAEHTYNKRNQSTTKRKKI